MVMRIKGQPMVENEGPDFLIFAAQAYPEKD
jgi:hypothetical protein